MIIKEKGAKGGSGRLREAQGGSGRLKEPTLMKEYVVLWMIFKKFPSRLHLAIAI